VTAPQASIHDLLVHAEFLRRLVRDLVADESAQHDLTQQVWLQALRSPPRDARGLRGWLAATARNLLANARRSQERRSVRETAAAPREHAPAADEILAREAVRESVLRAVLALDEPFREAVLLRYYEGLPPREIAARLGVPDATVRTRVARGLERLRVRLDAQHRDRSAWTIVALPLVRGDAATFGFAGALAVKKIAAILALLVLALVAWRVVAVERDDVPPARSGAQVAASPGPEGARTVVPALFADEQDGARRAATIAAPAAPRGRRTFAAQRGSGSIHGVVVDAFDLPLADVVVRARPHMGGTAPGLAFDDDRTRAPETATDASGRFWLADVDEGPVRVEAVFPGGSVAQRVVILGAGEDLGPLRIAAGDARPAEQGVHVLVVDAGGAPVADAEIDAFGWSRTDRDPERLDEHATRPAARGTSDAAGRAVLAGPALAHGVVFARSQDGRAGWSAIREQRLVRVQLAPSGSLAGVITGTSEESVRGAHLALHALSVLEPYYAAAGRRIDVALDGARFEARDVPAGTYAITLHAPGGARLVHPRLRWGEHELENSIAHVTVVVEPGRETRIELAAVQGARLHGRVTSSDAPVANARVRAVLAPRTPNFPAGFVLHGTHVWRFDDAYEQSPDSPVSHHVERTGADGRYAFPNLAAGRWRVEVAADGLTFDRRMDVELADGAAVELEHTLVEAGVLQVGTLETSYLGVFPADSEKPVMLAVVRDRCGTFAGLAPGRYRVASVHSDESVPHVFLGEATVEAGRTTWVDLRANEAPVSVRGIVRLDGAPLGRASVRVSSASAVTDEAGRFDLRLLRMPLFGAGFGASIRVQHAGLEHVFVPTGETGNAQRTFELELAGSALEIEVVDPDGLPVAARIEAEWTPTATSPNGPREASVRRGAADGRFSLAPLGQGSFAGRVTYTDGWSVRIECAVPRPEPLRIVRPASGTLTVRALRGGRPAGAQDVTLEAVTGSGDGAAWERAMTTEAEGRITLEAPAGTVTARLRSGFLAAPVSGLARVEPGGAAEILLELDG
jgi:RNA polymerase sigma-70 factor (ECF subfamily)